MKYGLPHTFFLWPVICYIAGAMGNAGTQPYAEVNTVRIVVSYQDAPGIQKVIFPWPLCAGTTRRNQGIFFAFSFGERFNNSSLF